MSKILIIEDSPLQAETIRQSLRDREVSAETLVVNSGNAALKTFGEWNPGIVILDLNLPDANGLEICQKIKSSQATHHIVLVVHSIENRLAIFNAAFGAGADYYVPKSNNSVADLTMLVSGILRRNGSLADNNQARTQSVQMMLAS